MGVMMLYESWGEILGDAEAGHGKRAGDGRGCGEGVPRQHWGYRYGSEDAVEVVYCGSCEWVGLAE